MIPPTTTKDQAYNIQPNIPTGHSDTSDQDDFNKMALEEQIQQYDEECYNYFDDDDDDDEEIVIDFDMFGSDPTTDTNTHIQKMIEEEPNPCEATDTSIHTDTTNIEEA